MTLIQTAPPENPVVSLDEAKSHLRIDADMDDDDDLISMLITAATIYAQMYTRRSFITQKWKLVLDAFPNQIQIQNGPVQSIESITYRALDRSMQVMSPNDYVVKSLAAYSPVSVKITPIFGKIWPIPIPEIGAVEVDFTAGYGDTSEDVPDGIRHWIMVRVNTAYENREENVVLARGKIEPLPFIDGLLDPYTLRSV